MYILVTQIQHMESLPIMHSTESYIMCMSLSSIATQSEQLHYTLCHLAICEQFLHLMDV